MRTGPSKRVGNPGHVARIDDVIEGVGDTRLRRELQSAIRELRASRHFGLVYEDHVAEAAALPDGLIRVGSTVTHRRQSERDCKHVVEALVKGRATLRDPEGRITSAPANELMLVKSFGEPVFPVLDILETVSRSEERASHAVIGGENFHVLQLLSLTHRGAFDCVYIDPPYNTGAKDWKYNNDYVDEHDSWRHSKWLSMMEKRLKLTKRLLKRDGVLIVTIDHNEVNHLGMLLERLFPRDRRQLVTICINPSGSSGEGLSRVEEFAYFVFCGNSEPTMTVDDMYTEELENAQSTDIVPVAWESLLRRGNQWYRRKRRNLCYPIYVNPHTGRICDVGEPLVGEDDERIRERDGLDVAWPVRKDGRLGIWRVDNRRLRNLVERGYAFASRPDPGRGTWSLKYLMSGTIEAIEQGVVRITGRGCRGQVILEPRARASRVAKTVWKRGRHTAGGQGGTQLVAAQLGQRDLFSYPKSVYAVQDCLQVAVGDRRDALVLDYFAGSGTTLNAVALMNHNDGGSRRCVLVTNNEVSEEAAEELNERGHFRGDPAFEAAGIYEAVTRPRCRAVITGRTSADVKVAGTYLSGHRLDGGFEENVAFLKLRYVDPDDVSLGHHLSSILPLLWLAAGAAGDCPRSAGSEAWIISESAPLGVLIDPDAFRGFLREVAKRPEITDVWLVTDDESAFARMRDQLHGRKRVSMLYREYLRNFVVNTGRA